MNDPSVIVEAARVQKPDPTEPKAQHLRAWVVRLGEEDGVPVQRPI
jgi:hypothetical protein